MEKKKMLFLGLVLIAVILFLFIVLGIAQKISQLTQENKSLTQEKESLRSSNDSLRSEINKVNREKLELQSKISNLDKDLARLQQISQENADLKRKNDQISKERDDLVEKINKLKAELEIKSKASVQQPAALPPGASDDLYWAGILKEKTNLELQVATLKDELESLKSKFNDLEKQKIALETGSKNLLDTKEIEIKKLANEKQDLERRVSYNERLIDSLSLELVREKKDNRKLKEDYKFLNEENEKLRQKINALNSELDNSIKALNQTRADLEEKLAKAEQARMSLESKLMQVNSLLDEKATEILEMKQRLEMIKEQEGLFPAKTQEISKTEPQITTQTSKISRSPKATVELPAIVVRPPEAVNQEVDSGIQAKILEVNTSNKFIIFDQGEDQGIQRGMVLGVYRQGSRIGTVEVIQTRKTISAADIKEAKKPFKVGDIVK